jgi:hypothetical protein
MPGLTSLSTTAVNPPGEDSDIRMKPKSSVEPVTLKYWYAVVASSATRIVAA